MAGAARYFDPVGLPFSRARDALDAIDALCDSIREIDSMKQS